MVHDDDDDDDYSGRSFMMAVPNMEQPLPHICIWSLQQQRQWRPRRRRRQNDFSNRNETEVHILHGTKHCKRPSYSTVLTKQREKCRTRRVNVCVCVLLHVIWCAHAIGTSLPASFNEFKTLINIGLTQFSHRNNLCRWIDAERWTILW